MQQRLAALKTVPAINWMGFIAVAVLVTAAGWKNAVHDGRFGVAVLLLLPFSLFVAGPILMLGSVFRPSMDLRRRAAQQNRDCSLVRMTVLKDDYPIGVDEGLVYFEGDELAYEGQLTAFHISTGDVEAPLEKFADGALMRAKGEQLKFGNRAGSAAWGFILRARPDIRLFFFPLRADGHRSIYEPLFAWLKRTPSAGSDSLLPPVDPLPGYKPSFMVYGGRRKNA